MPTTPLQEKKTVQQLLEALQAKGGVAPLRELIAHLNYDPLNEVVSRKDWPDPAKAALASDPRLYGSAAGEFYVIYAQLSTDKLKLTEERTVIPQLLKDYPYALFIFSDKVQKDFHFVNVKWESTQKRRLYRRIAVGPQERLRTAVERITMLDPQTIEAGLFGVTAQQIQDVHDHAFDVSKVTKDFYEEYKRVFEAVRDSVKGFGSTPEELDRRHLFAQRLFNRLMFLRFIQKKGWLEIDGDKDYLAALWRSHGKLKQDGKNFYADRLRLLFAALNDERTGIVLQGNGGAVEATIGKVKYLNGGLFEETEEDKDPKVRVADAPFRQIFDPGEGLFERFNFTITESTPLDIEIAVDPEMLGKIFEELVTGRHDSGSYYTPKPIVSFMCREGLKGYLETQVPGEAKDVVAQFVDHHEPKNIRNAEAVLEALKRVTVCDPACGSGAYLLGMMHELLDLRQCLFQTRQVDNKTMYQRKLDVIQTNIYGVDIADFAVNIARLRLWLSLAVDYEGPEPQPLPNLKYKIETGDSVSSPSPSSVQFGLYRSKVTELLELKKRYLTAHHTDKHVLDECIQELRDLICGFTQRDPSEFDWAINFAEVFVNGGFDVVLANPPYVRQEKIKHLKMEFKRIYKEQYSGTADLYVFFYLRGLEILRPDGLLSYISSNKWLRADYGKLLRAHIAATATVSSITDFGELPVFETAATFPMIFVARRRIAHNQPQFRFTQVKSLAAPYPDMELLVSHAGSDLPWEAVSGREWRLVDAGKSAWIAQMEASGIPLAKYVDEQIYYGIKTGFNEAFVIDDETRKRLIKEDPKSKELIHPMAKGDDVRRWRIEDKGRWIIITEIGVDIKRYPAIFKHLKQWRAELEERSDKGDHWWELRPCTYYSLFQKARIVFPDMAKESRFAYVEGDFVSTNTTYLIPSDDLFLLGVLNSDSVWNYAKEKLTVMGDAEKGGRLRFFTQFVRQIPIPNATRSQKASISAMVRKCLNSRGQGCTRSEVLINEQVAVLFGLRANE